MVCDVRNNANRKGAKSEGVSLENAPEESCYHQLPTEKIVRLLVCTIVGGELCAKLYCSG